MATAGPARPGGPGCGIARGGVELTSKRRRKAPVPRQGLETGCAERPDPARILPTATDQVKSPPVRTSQRPRRKAASDQGEGPSSLPCLPGNEEDSRRCPRGHRRNPGPGCVRHDGSGPAPCADGAGRPRVPAPPSPKRLDRCPRRSGPGGSVDSCPAPTGFGQRPQGLSSAPAKTLSFKGPPRPPSALGGLPAFSDRRGSYSAGRRRVGMGST